MLYFVLVIKECIPFLPYSGGSHTRHKVVQQLNFAHTTFYTYFCALHISQESKK